MGLKLKITPSTSTISGLLDFDGSTWVELWSEDVSINGNRTVSFKLWLDKDSGYGIEPVFSFGDVDIDHLNVTLLGDDMRFMTSNTSGPGDANMEIPITGLDNQILNFEVTKSTNNIDQVKLNDVIQELSIVT